jgi:uncharacterized delta-60 repeat protein
MFFLTNLIDTLSLTNRLISGKVTATNYQVNKNPAMQTTCLVLFLSLFLVPHHVLGQFGILDPTFGINGISLINPAPQLVIANAITCQNDGKIVLAGTVYYGSTFNSSDMLIIRLDTQGKLDSTFSNDGIVFKNIYGQEDRFHAVHIQSDGKILAAGSSESGLTRRLILMRFNQDGSLDTAFNNTGIVSYHKSGYYSRAYSIAQQNDGKIIVAGSHGFGVDKYSAIIIRYNLDGSMDEQFGEGGIVKIDLAKNTQANEVICLPNGKILVSAGAAPNISSFNPVIIKLNEDGTMVSFFGSQGVVVVESDTSGSAGFFDIGIQNGNKIILSAGYKENYKLLRFDALTGQLDESFGVNGRVIVDMGQQSIQSGLEVQSDGKILTSGHSNSFSTNDVLLLRFEPDGNPDTTFGLNGMVITDIGMNTDDASYDICIQKDGKIVLTGLTKVGANFSIPVLRFLSGLIVNTVEKTEKQLSPSIYPNPSGSVISFEYNLDAPQETSLLIYDEQGRLAKIIHRHVQNGPGPINEQIQIDDLPSGVYFIHLKTQQSGQVIKKFIKN